MILYLDLIMLLNFMINSLILSLTSYLAKVNLSFLRLLFGAFIATLSVPLLFIMPQDFVQHVSWKIIYSIFILISTFGIMHFHRMIHLLLLFYFISFSLGGGLIAVHYLMNESISSRFSTLLLTVHNIYGDKVHLSLVILGVPLLLLLVKNRMDQHVKEKIKYEQLYECIVTINGISHHTTGFFDSGNHLSDPITNRPLILCDKVFLQRFFSEEDWEKLESIVKEQNFSNVPASLTTKISLIPYYSAAGKNDIIVSIVPDYLTVIVEEEKIETDRVLIGIQLHNLTHDNRYHCLLHPELIYRARRKVA